MPETHLFPTDSIVSQRYRILQFVGGGAMAKVYKVEDMTDGSIHALKVLRNPAQEDGTRATQFAATASREAGFLKALRHPSLPRFTDLFTEDDRVFLVMDFVEGENLKHFLEQNENYSLDIISIVGWGIQIADVLTYLHEQKPPVIFRDLKPSNLIRRPDDRICLVDFGIARYYARHGVSSDTVVLGSPGYAPPEQYGQEQTGPRADIYALGATLHHLLTGRDPSIAPFKWPLVSSLNPVVPRVLENLVMKCVELDLQKRPENAESVARSLREIMAMLHEAHRPLPESGTGKLHTTVPLWRTRPDAPTDVLTTLSEDGSPVENPVAAAQVLSGEITFAQADYAPVVPLQVWKNTVFLRRWLLIGAIFAVIGSLGLPLLSGMLEPAIPSYERLPLPPPDAAPERRLDYTAEMERLDNEVARARTARSAYRSLLPLRLLLALLVCAAFFFGSLLPVRSSRPGLILCMGGALGLLCLTATLLLPDWTPLFLLLAPFELMLLAPPFLLFLHDDSNVTSSG